MNVLDPGTKKENFCFRPSFLARLLGASDLEITISGTTAELRSRNSYEDTELSTIRDLATKEGFFLQTYFFVQMRS